MQFDIAIVLNLEAYTIVYAYIVMH